MKRQINLFLQLVSSCVLLVRLVSATKEQNKKRPVAATSLYLETTTDDRRQSPRVCADLDTCLTAIPEILLKNAGNFWR